MLFVLINEASGSSPLGAQVTDDWLSAVAAACTVQLNRDLAPYWGGAYSVRAGSGPTDIAPGEIAAAILETLPDAPGAVAYHDVQGNDVPYIVLGLDTCRTLADISLALSHEFCETAADPACNAWRDDGQGREWAQEACDAVESYSYTVGPIEVSDFVLPAFFAPTSLPPYHHLSATGQYPELVAPFATAPGGYQIVRASGTGQTQVEGQIVWHMAKRRHWSSRTYRRGVRLG